jgi:hydroxylaminobenzene mutase
MGPHLASSDLLQVQRRLYAIAACLFSVGLATGVFSAAVLTGKISSGMPRMALAAHLNALLGALWIAVVAVSLPFVALSGRRLRQTCALVVVANWANGLLKLVGALLGVSGLAYTGQRANDGLAFALQAVAWTYGLLRKERS